MKRTSVITLAIIGALAAGCAPSAPDGPTTYANVRECVSDGLSQETCEKALAEATAAVEKEAPKYASQAECAAQFGSCAQSSSGGWFMPALMGYMVGSSMNGGSTRYVSQPVYIDRNRNLITGNTSDGKFVPAAAPTSYTAKTAARTAASSSSRGGFGSRSTSSSS